MTKIEDIIYHQHDIVCSQKYGDSLPYSFHLKAVEAQGEKFIHLIEVEAINNSVNYKSVAISSRNIVRAALLMHDTLEDSRLSYNDILRLTNQEFENYTASEMVADIVYCVTDEKGKNRAERKSEKYYQELSENRLAVFVKLADLAANTLYSKLTGSSMYDRYKGEFSHFKEKLYISEFEEFFNYVENL